MDTVCERWYKEFDKLLHQCFKKIRITNVPPKKTMDYELYQNMVEINVLKSLDLTSDNMNKAVVDAEIRRYESNIAKIQGEKCKKLIHDETKNLRVGENFNPNVAWSLKKKLFPKYSESPFAIYNKDEQLVTDAKGILEVMKDEFAYRLRNRTIDREYSELKGLKEYLCELRLEITRNSDYVPWSMTELKAAICKLKNGKCKDPHGHINELYRSLGIKGLEALLELLNRIKKEIIVPTPLRLSNVSTIYKGKGSKRDVLNLRGIFKLPIIRNILDRLIYKEEQEVVNDSMGQFQVGNQTGRSIRDHTLIVHAVVNDAITNNIELDILFTDIKQCFDSIWLEEAINDLYDSGIQSRNLNLLYEGNKSTDMCVETKFGRSDRVCLRKVVMQGSVTGGMLCSNQLSKICNNFFKSGTVYMYSNTVAIPALAMVDDLIAIALCNSVEGIKNNIKTDEFIKSKKLEGQVGEGKCQWVHVGKSQCPASYVVNDTSITQSKTYKYLGDHVSDGFDCLYQKRYEKSQGYVATVLAMCTEISLGFQIYSIAKLLLQAIFLNGTMVNMETWPNFNDKRVSMFERAEQSILRKILNAHSKTPIECLYLELGIIPFRFHLMKRRLTYYQVLMRRNDDEITKAIVMHQKQTRLKGDFYMQVINDLGVLQISETEVIYSSEEGLKDLLKKKTHDAAYTFLMDAASKHSKVNNEAYENLEGMVYFEDTRFTPDLSNLLFKFRTRMFNVRNNFRNQYRTNLLCPLCNENEDSQEHLLECKIITEELGSVQCQYEDIFSKDPECLLKIAEVLKKAIKVRIDKEYEIST